MAAVEQWLPIEGYEGIYEVSDAGRIRSLPRTVATGVGNGSRPAGGRILKPTPNEKGYLSFMVSTPGTKPRRIKVHLAVITAFHGPRPSGLIARHLNGNAADNRAENLTWGTYAENSQDAIAHGTTWQQNRTECPRGHKLEAPNLTGLLKTKGYRECLACKRARKRIEYRGLSLDLLPEIADQCYREILAGDPHLATEDACKRGHTYTAANTQLDKLGRRTCRACAMANGRLYATSGPRDEGALQELADQVFALGGVLPPLPAKTRCKREHLLVEPNLVPSALKKGLRSCLACHRAQARLHHTPERKTEAAIQALADQNYIGIMTGST